LFLPSGQLAWETLVHIVGPVFELPLLMLALARRRGDHSTIQPEFTRRQKSLLPARIRRRVELCSLIQSPISSPGTRFSVRVRLSAK
jgi:hypothetical protein